MNKSILFLCLLSLISSKGPYQIENEVLVLNDQTFSLAMKEFKNLVVLFYDPECPHCKGFKPEYEKAASILKKENFVLSKIDCLKSEKICDRYEIEAFPTVALLKKDNPVVFYGKRTIEEIRKWLIENTKPIFKNISSKLELEEYKNNITAFLIYFGNDEKIINELIVAERKIDDIPIFTCNSEELIKENVNTEKNESIIIFKKFDEKKNIMKDDITAKNIIKFVDLYAYPKVIEFSKDTSYIIFTKRNPALIIFSSKTRKNYENIKKILNDIWPKVGSKIRLFICNEVDQITLIFSEYFTMEQLISSNAYIVHAENENPTKYVMSEDITEENILNFINKWDNGELEPIIKSQEVPKNNNGDVFILVGKNFKKEVLDNKKDVLVYFTSHFCRICKDFEPKLAELAKKLKHNNPNLLIAKMDAIANEVEGLQINKFPTIKFYPGNAKDKEPLGYFTRRNITGLYNFIKKNAYNKIIEDESNKITDL